MDQVITDDPAADRQANQRTAVTMEVIVLVGMTFIIGLALPFTGVELPFTARNPGLWFVIIAGVAVMLWFGRVLVKRVR